MSSREVRALGSNQILLDSIRRSKKPIQAAITEREQINLEPADCETQATTQENQEMDDLRDRVQELEQQLQEAQQAIAAGDGQLREVSAECERASGQARVASDLARGLTALTGSGPASLSTFFQSFLEAQQKLLVAQTNALAIQSAPPLHLFTGEDVEKEENTFEKWLERFEERATLLAWEDNQKCYQLKSHLSKMALQVFQLLTPEQQHDYKLLVTAMKTRFKPVDIEELRGLEFHQLMQSDESVEKLGLQLMSLARKAFPSLGDRELDRLLKGRFFQALLPKWQRKLGAPKVSESFTELYERARTCERHEQQYRANSRKDHSKPRERRDDHPSSGDATLAPGSSDETPPQRRRRQSTIKCFSCGGPHFKRDCPHKEDKSEALGRSRGTSQHNAQEQSGMTPQSKTAAVGVAGGTQSVTSQQQDLLKSLSDQQLEGVLAARHCAKEQSLLDNDQVNVSTVLGDGVAPVIGPTLELDISIEGVEVAAMVDTGAQSSIISRSTLLKVGRHLRALGKPVPKLQPASGVSVPVVLFVQPDSRQDSIC